MTVQPRKSFKLKLLLWILAVSLLTFGAVFFACIHFVRQEVKTELDAVVNAKLDYALRALDEGLTTTVVSAENLYSISQSPLISHRRDSIYSLLQHFLKSNPRIQGATVGYEPGYVEGHEEGFAPYVMQTAEGMTCLDIAELKDYRSMEWYRVAHDTDKPHWTKPFVESNNKSVITAYTFPLHDKNGKVFAVVALDLNLNVMADSLQSLRPYPNAMLTVIDQDGMFVAHPDKSYIMNKSLQTVIDEAEYAPNNAILDDIKAGRRGSDTYETKEDKHIIYYAPVAANGWTITLDVPRSEIVGGYSKMFKAIVFDVAIGVILLLIVSFVIINRLTKPLETFALAARQIAHGDFTVKLPSIRERNELYDLRSALASMEQSLNKYMADLEASTKSKALIEGELNIARKIQMAMLPKIFPPYPERKEIDIHASLTPAKAVGGDLYDFILDGDDLYFCIGDVSGKGVPAALFMAITRTLFRTVALSAKSPAKIATMMNDSISDGNDENMFVTMFIGKCNLATGEFTCCNCGHNAPLINGHLDEQKNLIVGDFGQMHMAEHIPTNIPIGVFGGFEYEEVTVNATDFTMFLYTDGVTEAEDKDKNLYGDDRLTEMLKGISAEATAKDIVQTVFEDVQRHAGKADQSDDITMLAISLKK